MKIRIVTLFAPALLLSACSDQDWQHALTYTGLGGSHDTQSETPAAQAQAASPPARQSAPAAETAAAASAPIPDGAQPRPNGFCENVASQDAGSNDFDAATQRRVFVQSYQQCVAIFGDATK